ncbi:MAG: hypothetical protein E6J90_32870 [Deltaproteobacteria bacterium]|nr:MAG: hypothetical protein E6J90_32870 [Deltaproteobacteria bacterium]TMQ23307.1 MAG: hypothetical protein E6J91_00305 [Deltaproteobacteria bacterium]
MPAATWVARPRAYPGALVLVSHDERFAARCTTTTWRIAAATSTATPPAAADTTRPREGSREREGMAAEDVLDLVAAGSVPDGPHDRDGERPILAPGLGAHDVHHLLVRLALGGIGLGHREPERRRHRRTLRRADADDEERALTPGPVPVPVRTASVDHQPRGIRMLRLDGDRRAVRDRPPVRERAGGERPAVVVIAWTRRPRPPPWLRRSQPPNGCRHPSRSPRRMPPCRCDRRRTPGAGAARRRAVRVQLCVVEAMGKP